jgi:hypothetical protein
MSKIGFVAILFLMMGKAYSQENYFVLIQAEDNKPFYAMLDGKTYPSSATGHLILSRLKDSTYLVTIGFPRDLFPEQQFSIKVNDKDLGFQLKNSGGNGWGLFDPQSMELKMPVKKEVPESKKAVEGVRKDDAFSRLMAGVVNDTAVMYADFAVDLQHTGGPGTVTGARPGPTQVPGSGSGTGSEAIPGLVRADNPEVKVDIEIVKGDKGLTKTNGVGLRSDSGVVKETAPQVRVDSGIVKANNKEGQSERPKQDSAGMVLVSVLKDSSAIGSSGKMAEPKVEKDSLRANPAPLVEKLSEKRTKKQVRLVFVDHNKGGGRDTIIVRIPMDTLLQEPASGVNSTGEKISKGKDAGVVQAGPSHSGNNFSGPALAGEGNLVQNKIRPDSSFTTGTTRKGNIAANSSSSIVKNRPVLGNSDCRGYASDDDVNQLKAKMMTAISDRARIDLAKKVFRNRCFTSSQVKALNKLFMNDEGRFGLLEAAYPFVTDSEQFKSLVNLLTDPNVVGRFKKMTGQL